jgi:Tfp pilus assembly protein PilE
MIQPATTRRRRFRGISFPEVIAVAAVLGVLATLGVPQYHRAVEQGRLNTAAQHLRSIWSAQRIFWLEHRSFADSLSDLNGLGLLAPEIADGEDGVYTYVVESAGASTFRITATRQATVRWNGALEIDESGIVSGALTGISGVLTPAEF